mgnify:CR=1 FL=1
MNPVAQGKLCLRGHTFEEEGIEHSVVFFREILVELVEGFDELLTDADGNCLWVTSHPVADLPDGVRDLGVVPWSPRTPVVRPTPG